MKNIHFKTLSIAIITTFILGQPLFSQMANPVRSGKATTVAAVSITVEDMEREIDFFTKTLDFQKVKEETFTGQSVAALFGLGETGTISVRAVTLQLGNEQIRLLDFEGIESRPIAPDTKSNDLWFQHLAIVVSDMDKAYQRLLAQKVVHVSTAPQTLPTYLPNAAGIKAFYFRDPEGHNLELIGFPPDKGNPKWQSTELTSKMVHPDTIGNLFLGIDHTAIAISDNDNSFAFYRDGLGLDWGGHSENYGTEQEHLNQVFGARLDINGLHATNGFGVEFLRYIAPPNGRKIPSDTRPSDLWYYQTEILVENIEELKEKLKKQGFQSISNSKVQMGQSEEWLLRDPDGHAVLLREMIGKN
jgi:catechol 2,3-dioxygenase-like lactoylglutathione lyase family enzyme